MFDWLNLTGEVTERARESVALLLSGKPTYICWACGERVINTPEQQQLHRDRYHPRNPPGHGESEDQERA